VPWILRNGADWFKKLGPEKSPGMKLFAFSGHIEKPQVVELPMGLPFKDVLQEICGGVWRGRKLKAVIPGGSSSKILTAEKAMGVTLDFESCAGAGSMLGTASVIILDETQCIVEALENVSHFYGHESCGQCTPCREGVGWMHKIIARIEAGKGRPEDLDLLLDIQGNIQGNTICAFGDAAAWPVESYIKTFRPEFEAHISEKKCPFGNVSHAH
jgi:NADH-quinone oxidoreductase subunit F